jgi:hypothetical protein
VSGEQTIHLEVYEPQVRAAFARAQTLADERKHHTVTWYHLVRVMLDVGWGTEPCVRAAEDPAALLARVDSMLDDLPANAGQLAYLDARLLEVMKAAEVHAKKLARAAVDFQCVFVALGEKQYVSPAIGAQEWSREERTGSAKEIPPTLEAALFTSAKALEGLPEQIATALGMPRMPKEVARTLQKIRAQFYAPNEVPELLVERHDGCILFGREDKSEDDPIILQWAPPAAIELVTGAGAARSAQRFELVRETNTWRAGERELFEAVRAAIVALYPEANRPPN